MSRGHFVGIDYHRRLLSDRVRNEAFLRAIEAQVKPGMTVYDIGTGTGILALIAARAGAGKVIAIEPAPIIKVAERLARDNGLSQTIEFIQADSRTVKPTELADVLVSECLGNFFITDEMQPVIRDAARFLAPDGVCIPRSVRLQVAPVRLPLFQGIQFYREPCLGFDLRAALPFALNRAYVLVVEPEFVIGSSCLVGDFPLLQAPDSIRQTFHLEIDREAHLEGLVGWFDVDLGADVHLSTRPGVLTHWGQMVFPLDPVTVGQGDWVDGEIGLTVDAEQARSTFAWRGTVHGPHGTIAEFEHDTDKRF